MAETVEERVTRVYGEAGLARLHAEQKAKLLPQLEKRLGVLEIKAETLDEECETIRMAIAEIKAGRITDYQLRRKKERAEA